MKLYTYWRSSAAYRVRIALELKGLPYESVPKHLLRDGGEQRRPDYLELNPQGLIPGFDLRLWGAMPHANALGGLALFYLIVERLVPWKNNTLRWLAWG